MAKISRTPVVQAAQAAPRPLHALRLGVALFVSCGTHFVLLAMFVLIAPAGSALSQQNHENVEDPQVLADAQESLPIEMFDVIDPDLSGLNTGGEASNDSNRTSEATIPGLDDPREKIGLRDGSDANPPISIPTPPGFGPGHGGADQVGPGMASAFLPSGGAFSQNPYDYRNKARLGASGGTIETFKKLGATGASEAAVARGLMWIVRQQAPDGHWALDGAFKDKGTPNDVAGTGFGLLPLLAAGKTHKPAKDNPYDKIVARGLRYLITHQDAKRGDLGGTMYSHGIATIALSEAYGLTQDPLLRLPAQRAVNFIVYAQHEKGGWRYAPGQEGDLSITGWQVMALKSAQMAGLDVPVVTLKRADRFIDSVTAANEGYGYVDTNPMPTMSAVGLLCRQFMHGWGPQNLRLIKGINANLKPAPPGSRKEAYYHYYATQVMYHFGGDAWKNWNQQMHNLLVKSQEADKDSPNFGSWSSLGDTHGSAGGRLMVTSLNMLTLEVYYRYLPLYYRDVGAKL